MKILNKITAVLLAVILSVYVIIAPVKAKAFILELTAAETALVLLIGGILVTTGYISLDELSEMSPGDLNNYIAENAFDFSGLDSQTKGSLTQDMHDYIHSPEGASMLLNVIDGALSLPLDVAGFFDDWFYESSQDIPGVPTPGDLGMAGIGAMLILDMYINGKYLRSHYCFSEYGKVQYDSRIGYNDYGLINYNKKISYKVERTGEISYDSIGGSPNHWVYGYNNRHNKIKLYGDWRIEGTLEPYTRTEDFTYTYPIVGTVDIGGTHITITSDGTAADEQGSIYPFEDGAVIAGGVPYFPEFDFSVYGFDSLFGLIASLFNAVEEAIEEIAGEEEEEPELNPPPYPGDDPTQSPGEDWEWRGREGSVPGDNYGAWYNPKTGETLHPDLNHPEPKLPHWDYIPYKNGPQYDYFPDGSLVLKT